MMKKLILALTLIFNLNALCLESKQPLTQEQKIHTATGYVIAYLDHLTSKNAIGVAHLQKMIDASELINPITAEEKASSIIMHDYSSQLDNVIEKGKKFIDFARVKEWATKKIEELERAEGKRKEVHEDTREIHIPMRFVPIPAGKYVDQITGEEFEIPEGIEIQETPVTQWQWFYMVTDIIKRLAFLQETIFNDGPGGEEIKVPDQSNWELAMRANAPVMNISGRVTEDFIKALNEAATDFEYALPSVLEYQALLQHILGKDWWQKFTITCANPTMLCTVDSGNYIELHGKRIWDIVGNAWQWTRDIGTIKDKTAHLVFGGSVGINKSKISCLKDVLRPIIYDDSKGETVGLRLIRYKKQTAYEQKINNYTANQLSWNQEDCSADPAWQWDEATKSIVFEDDFLRWMMDHKNGLGQDTKHTLDVITSKDNYHCYGFIDPIDCLKEQTDLTLENYYKSHSIKDLSPFLYLKNLKSVDLSDCQINDFGDLANIANLRALYLGRNQIHSLESLRKFKNLYFLDVHSNEIFNISALYELKSLGRINIGYNSIPLESLLGLNQLKKYTEVHLDRKQIKSIHGKPMKTAPHIYTSPLLPNIGILRQWER